MSSPSFFSHRRGHLITPSDGTDQPNNYNQVVCVTAGNLVFRLVDPTTNAETADITLAMTATQVLAVTPKKVMATGTTGTYLGLVTA